MGILNLVKRVGAQVNPFDNGATYSHPAQQVHTNLQHSPLAGLPLYSNRNIQPVQGGNGSTPNQMGGVTGLGLPVINTRPSLGPSSAWMLAPGTDTNGLRRTLSPQAINFLHQGGTIYNGAPGDHYRTFRASPPPTAPYVAPGWTYGPVGNGNNGWRDPGGVPGILPSIPSSPDAALPPNTPFSKQNSKSIQAHPQFIDPKKVSAFNRRVRID